MKTSAQTQKMLRLLAQVILADGHILETEIKALAQGARELAFTDENGRPLTAQDIQNWFDDYLDELNRSRSKERKDLALTRLILSLSEWPNKEAVVETLEKISLADSHFHRDEKTFISIVKAYWQHDGLDAPGSKIMS